VSTFTDFFDWLVTFFTNDLWVYIIKGVVYIKLQILISSINFSIKILDISIQAVNGIIGDLDIFGRFQEYFDLIPDEILSILTLLNAQAIITIILAAYVARMTINLFRSVVPGLPGLSG